MTPAKELKVGDRVRVVSSPYIPVGSKGNVVSEGCPLVTVKFDNNVHDLTWEDSLHGCNCLYVGETSLLERIEPVKHETITLGVPTIADDLMLKPQARKILAHLEAGHSISPLEAMSVYSVYRLAASIFELREAGYRIDGKRKQDEAGHKYMRYSLIPKTAKAA